MPFFKDKLTSTDLEIIRGSLPQLGFVPADLGAARAWEGSYNPQPMRRSEDGAKSLNDSARIVYGVDVSNLAGTDTSAWVPNSVEWEATFEFHLSYYDTSGSNYNLGEIQLGNARTPNVLLEFLATGGGTYSARLSHGVTYYGNDGGFGQVRSLMPDVTAIGFYKGVLRCERTKFTLELGGMSMEIGHLDGPASANFDSIVVFLSTLLQLRNLEVRELEAPPAPFWTGFRQTVEK